ncbi:hypothetical protein TNCV_7071 [Trichonephila clavipes]|nr:hypothetical protein TNCV_7071 [Trichonephila clavipes]
METRTETVELVKETKTFRDESRIREKERSSEREHERGWKTHRQIFRLCRGWKPIDKYSACVEVGKPIDENPACVELAQLEKEVELQRVKNKALSLNPAAKFEEKQFKTLNKETATHIGIREAEDWFRPIDLAKECDIYISSRSGSRKETPITYGYTQDPFKNRSQNFKPKIKENYPQYHERENKNCFICGDSSHCARDCEKRFKPKESNDHIHNKINVNTLKIESEKQNSEECANLQYVNIFCGKSARNSID